MYIYVEYAHTHTQHTHTHIYIYIYVYIFIHIYVCIYIYVEEYMYMNECTYLYRGTYVHIYGYRLLVVFPGLLRGMSTLSWGPDFGGSSEASLASPALLCPEEASQRQGRRPEGALNQGLLFWVV